MTNPKLCEMCGNCCHTPPVIRDYEKHDVESALERVGINEEAFDGRKLILRDDYCIALDLKTMKCRLHDVFKPSICTAKSCNDSLPIMRNFNWSKEVAIMQKEIAIERHGRIAEQYFESRYG